MKKIYTLPLIAFFLISVLKAQEPSDFIAQPQSIVGRKINTSGEIMKEYEASFSYLSDGKLDGFQFSEWGVSSAYDYDSDFLIQVLTQHNGMWPYYSDVVRLVYEAGRVKTEAHVWDAMNASEYYEYFYDDDGRLYRKNFALYQPEQVNEFSLYEYVNKGKTRIESHYWIYSENNVQLDYIITGQYDDGYTLLLKQKDTYNASGVITKSTRTIYTYTAQGLLEVECSQTLTEDEWVNNNLHRYIYDNNGHIMEQQLGVWSNDFADWNINKKIIHEYSEEPFVYTVSFYKKNGDDWVYDIFDNQIVFFAPECKWQQKALTCFAYEDLFGSALVNQFEFEMVYTKIPTYMSVEENNNTEYRIYPTPGKKEVSIIAPIENAVIRFYDLQGRMLFAKPFDFGTTISTGDWTPGFYLWEIWNGTRKKASGKWIKE